MGVLGARLMEKEDQALFIKEEKQSEKPGILSAHDRVSERRTAGDNFRRPSRPVLSVCPLVKSRDSGGGGGT